MTENRDRQYHDEAGAEDEQQDINRRKENLVSQQEEDGGPKRQHGLDSTEQRTFTERKELENPNSMQRRGESAQTDPSRSSSRRDRRKRVQKIQQHGKYVHTSTLEGIEEADSNTEPVSQRPFERIGPDSTSMDGPVTHARAMRGEIPLRGGDPMRPEYISDDKKQIMGGGGGGSDLKEKDGLKLTLEANLDIEIELKASIRGDLTLTLL
jgi:hypothetical protein